MRYTRNRIILNLGINHVMKPERLKENETSSGRKKTENGTGKENVRRVRDLSTTGQKKA